SHCGQSAEETADAASSSAKTVRKRGMPDSVPCGVKRSRSRVCRTWHTCPSARRGTRGNGRRGSRRRPRRRCCWGKVKGGGRAGGGVGGGGGGGEAAEGGDTPGPEWGGDGLDARHGAVGDDVVVPVLGRQAAAAVDAGKDLGAAVGGLARVNGDGRRDEGAWEARPGDVVLVQVVAAGARRLEDQLVLEPV